MNFVNVVIIDSGLSVCHKFKHIKNVYGVSINKSDNIIKVGDCFTDDIGHGTIVANILDDNLNVDIDLYVIKIFEKALISSVDLLVSALDYCYNNIDCNIIQVSLGSLYTTKELYNSINNLTTKGVTIISAFDNEASISYPAAYNDVIGVDISNKYNQLNQFDVYNTNVVDIQGADVYYRTRGLLDNKTIVRGSSFLCSYISAVILNDKPQKYDKKSAFEILKRYAVKVWDEKRTLTSTEITINNAVVFPFNKETHSLAAFERLIAFNIVGYYDVRQKGKINKRVCDLLKYSDNEAVIKDFESIDWNSDFDTFICGHIVQLSKSLKTNMMDRIFNLCLTYDKQLICFDNVSDYIKRYPKVRAFFPYVDDRCLPMHRFGKLRSPNIPIVGVFGTSSRQGKMTLQLYLREALLKRNIRINNIGSEPESALFGFEGVYTFGYGSTDYLEPMEMITVLNEIVYKLERNNCEIIIAGSQSGTVPNQLRNLSMIPMKQYCFLLGTQPDSIILCINDFDTDEYIERTIAFFKAAVNANVICLIVSELHKPNSGLTKRSKDYFESKFGIPTFSLKSLNINDVIDTMMKYYGEA